MKKLTAFFITLSVTQKIIASVALVCGALILVGGIVVVVELRNFCKKHGLDGSTNAPPVSVPTNSPATNTTHTVLVGAVQAAGQTYHINDDFIEYTDITGYYPASDGEGLPFVTELKFRVSVGEGMNGPWTIYCATGWASSRNLLICYYSNGVPALTNYSSLTAPGRAFLAPTNRASQFFKFETP